MKTALNSQYVSPPLGNKDRMTAETIPLDGKTLEHAYNIHHRSNGPLGGLWAAISKWLHLG
ncbi:hypothetical protein FNU76_17150 [Chitinimonas arctica]|uniref:Uncharacterized protein n=1 Tax=Chitinimonas arctica TaxID=2594795 RepID=A0A516SIF3_9NEIS|nr:hypothetical protein [Chitinimonas arctica]QDQ27931.1 hypothetical protein FNU76_17150 [Chitinimonas arctica]